MAKMKIRVIDAYIYKKNKTGIDFLILKRAHTKIYEHLWQGVAGKIESGEEAWEAAIRELKEETNLTPSKMFIADHVSSFYEKHGDRINFVPVFGIEVDSMDVTLSDEHCEYKWVELDKALSNSTHLYSQCSSERVTSIESTSIPKTGTKFILSPCFS